jgi:hypothetical protein
MISFKLLLENRVDFLRKYYEGRKGKITFNKLEDTDPTKKKTYLQWIINLVLSGKLLEEDLYKVKDALIIFDRIKNKFSKRDINQYKEYRDLIDEADSLSNSKSGKELKYDEYEKALKDSTILYKGSEGSIVVPKSKEASCILGRGTKWCTAAKNDNAFHDYNRQGPLYIITTKSGKYQFHFQTDSLMDERDRKVEFDSFNRKYPWVFNKIKITEQEQLKAVSRNGLSIRYINNPSEKVQLAAVAQDAHAIMHINNPSEKVQLAAVTQNEYIIQYINNPSEKVQLGAVDQDGAIIRYINNPSEKVKMFAKENSK